jgi:hypothetical protein
VELTGGRQTNDVREGAAAVDPELPRARCLTMSRTFWHRMHGLHYSLLLERRVRAATSELDELLWKTE